MSNSVEVIVMLKKKRKS